MSTADKRLCSTPMHLPSGLHKLLSTFKDIKPIGTLDEVLEAVKTYIFKRKLFDNINPSFIKCDEDLRRVLGVANFSLTDIKRILLRKLLVENKHIYSDLMAIVTGTSCAKRKCGEAPPEVDKKLCLDQERSEKSNIENEQESSFICASLSAVKCLENDDSSSVDYSSSEDAEISHAAAFAGGEILAINKMYDIEYEIEDSSDTDLSFTDSESELEDILEFAVLTKFSASDSDEAFWADESSDEDSSSDVEISSSDKWICKTCNSQNKPPMRYCLRCFEERTGWVTHREKSEMWELRKMQKRTKSSEKKIDSSSQAEIDKKNVSSNDQDSEFSDLCMLCCSKPKKSVIVHGKSGHSVSCYKCARRLLSSSKRCPICKRQIDRVIHLDS